MGEKLAAAAIFAALICIPIAVVVGCLPMLDARGSSNEAEEGEAKPVSGR